jgi:succinate dehydrogenase membrane anchor subunit
MSNATSAKVPAIKIMRSQLGRARGLGAAKSGLHHWWAQRVTAMALLPLSLYFVLSVLILAGSSQAEVAAYIAEPWNAVLFIALIVALFYHLALGLQVVIEDYVHGEGAKLASLLVMRGVVVLLALASLISVLKLAI